MKFERTPRFDKDYKDLVKEQQQQFRSKLPAFNAACDSHADDPAGFSWPKSLRVSQLKSVTGIWEMTWSFASPDGRATFEFVTIEAELRVRWRRIGSHRSYREP